MAFFSNSFGVTESDIEETIENSLGSFSDTNVYNGWSTKDQKTWGDSVSENNGRLEFSKKYLYFTFDLERSNINEMASLDKGVITFTNSTGTSVEYSLGKGGEAWMHTS